MNPKWLLSRVVLPALCAFAGCASQTGVIQAGAGTFMVARQVPTGTEGLETLKADAKAEAAEFCTRKGKDLQLLSAMESQPPDLFRSYSRVEVQFRCY